MAVGVGSSRGLVVAAVIAILVMQRVARTWGQAPPVPAPTQARVKTPDQLGNFPPDSYVARVRAAIG